MKAPYLIRKRGRLWYYRLAGQRTFHSTGLADKGKAIARALEKVAERAGAAQSAQSLTAFAGTMFEWGSSPWIAKQHAKGRPFGEGAARANQYLMKNHILPQFGTTAVSAITRAAVENWLVSLTLSNSTRNHILGCLRTIFKEAVAAGVVRESPLRDSEPFGRTFRPRDAFSVAELRLLFPLDMHPVWKNQWKGLFFLTLASTGIRAGEARALTWRQVLWGDRALLVDQAVKSGSKSIGPTKTGETRVVLMPSRLVDELTAWHGEQAWNEPQDYIFPGIGRGEPLSAAAVSHGFPGALARAGVSREGRNLVVHSFRHTYNTLLRRTVPAETLRALTGHKTSAMSDRYDHPEVADRVSALEPARKVVEGLLATGDSATGNSSGPA